MGGTPCVIIIIGNEMQGNVAGIFESFAEAEPYLTPDERMGINSFLSSAREYTNRALTNMRAASGVSTGIIINGAQLAGNLSALCDSATDNDLPDNEKAKLVEYIDEQRKTAAKWLQLMRERAAKDTD